MEKADGRSGHALPIAPRQLSTHQGRSRWFSSCSEAVARPVWDADIDRPRDLLMVSSNLCIPRISVSRQIINEYRAELDRLRIASGSRRESILREAFKDLLKHWGRTQGLQFTPEHDIVTPQKNRIYLDGALLHALRVPFGYWEAKDADDDLDAEIAATTRRGYPRDNITYSDDHIAVLIQSNLSGGLGPTNAPLFHGTTGRWSTDWLSDHVCSTTLLLGREMAAEERWG